MERGVSFRESIFNAVASSLEYTTYRFNNHAAVVAISERVAQDIVRFYRCSKPIYIIRHGVDLRLFSPANRRRWRSGARARYGLPDNETVFLYVGDLRKGADRCLRALSQLQRGRLLFVSRTPIGPYQRMMHDAGLVGRVLFLGATDQVEQIYAAADALLLPTPYDAFAMVVLEAMACGLPVIVSREAGASELIRNGVNGLLLEDASVPELARYMRLLWDARWAAELGRAARESVESRSWDTVAEQTMRVYIEVLQRRNKFYEPSNSGVPG